MTVPSRPFPPPLELNGSRNFVNKLKRKHPQICFLYQASALPPPSLLMALPLRKYFFLWLSDCVTLCAIYTNIQYNISLYNRQFHNSLPRKSARVHLDWGRELKNDLYVSEHIKEALNYQEMRLKPHKCFQNYVVHLIFLHQKYDQETNTYYTR